MCLAVFLQCRPAQLGDLFLEFFDGLLEVRVEACPGLRRRLVELANAYVHVLLQGFRGLMREVAESGLAERPDTLLSLLDRSWPIS